VRYFDENYEEITEKEYGEKLRTFNFFEVPGDSAHHRLLTTGRESGRITNRKVLESLLEKTTGQDLDSSKPLVILYYPSPDPCNSSGTKKKRLIREWYSELEEGLDQVVNVKPVYIYKESQGLDKYDGVVKWHKDPQRIVEKLFFKYHYPCSSFVVISSEGDYICVFGEHGKEVVWEATYLLQSPRPVLEDVNKN
jgi:hypothetical protein